MVPSSVIARAGTGNRSSTTNAGMSFNTAIGDGLGVLVRRRSTFPIMPTSPGLLPNSAEPLLCRTPTSPGPTEASVLNRLDGDGSLPPAPALDRFPRTWPDTAPQTHTRGSADRDSDRWRVLRPSQRPRAP